MKHLIVISLFILLKSLPCSAQDTGKSEVLELMAHLEERAILVGLSLDEGIERLQKVIHDEYQYRLVCESGIFVHLDAAYCLQGTLTFFRTLRQELLPANPNPLAQQEVIISYSETWEAPRAGGKIYQIRIPYDCKENDLVSFLHFSFHDRGIRLR